MASRAKFDLPVNDPATADAVNATHVLARMDPNVWDLRFQLYVPKNWSIETNFSGRMVEQREPVLLGLFLEEERAGSALISVVGYRLDMEVNLEDWLDHVLAQQGLSAFGGRWVQTPNGRCWDAGVAQGEPARRTFSRVTIYAVAGIVFLVTSQCEETRWEALKGSLMATNFSFEVLDTPRQDAGRLERWLEWTGTSLPPVRTAYPAAWRTVPVPVGTEAIDAVDFKLPDAAGERLLGYVRLKLTAAGKAFTSDALLAVAVGKLRENGFEITPGQFARLPEDRYLALFPGHEGTWVYPARLGGDEAEEIRIGIRWVGERWAVATAIATRQSVLPFLWMRTKRTFEIVLGCAEPDRSL